MNADYFGYIGRNKHGTEYNGNNRLADGFPDRIFIQQLYSRNGLTTISIIKI